MKPDSTSSKTAKIVRQHCNISKEDYIKIIKDENIIIQRCNAIKKKYAHFAYFCASQRNVSAAEKEYIKHRREIRIEIIGATDFNAQDAWSKVMKRIIDGTYYLCSKAYFDRYGITTYYLVPKWKDLFTGLSNFENYVVPPPKEKEINDKN